MTLLNTKPVTLLLIVSILVSGVLSPLMAAVTSSDIDLNDQTTIHHSQGAHTHCHSDQPKLQDTSCTQGALCIDCCVFVESKIIDVTGNVNASQEPANTRLPLAPTQQFEVELPPPISSAFV